MNQILIVLLACLTNLAYTDENMFEDYITKSLSFWNVPGASIAIVKDGEIVMAKGFGKNVDAETLFPIASLTKSYSSVAAGIFTDQKKWIWSSPFKRFGQHLSYQTPMYPALLAIPLK